MIGVRANVSMGETRTINIFVLGSAKYPGSYTVSGLATVTTALFAAGGVQPIGSLRNVQVKRQGETVRTFDLYDLLMRGDSTNDIKLLPGDVVFIPSGGTDGGAGRRGAASGDLRTQGARHRRQSDPDGRRPDSERR